MHTSMPSELIVNETTICGVPFGAGAIPVIANLRQLLASLIFGTNQHTFLVVYFASQ